MRDIRAVVEDPALLGLQQAEDHVHEGGLSGPGDAHDAHAAAGLDGQIDLLQHGLVAFGIGKADVLHPDIRLLCLVGDLAGDAVDGGLADVRAPVVVDELTDGIQAGNPVGDAADGAVDGVGAGHELDHRHGEGREAAHDGGEVLPQGNLDGHQAQNAADAEDLHQMPGHAGENGEPAADADEALAVLGVAVHEEALPTHDLDLFDSAHGLDRGLDHADVELPGLLARGLEPLADDEEVADGVDRQADDDGEGQPEIHQDQIDDQQDGDQPAGDQAHDAGDDLVGAGDVVVDGPEDLGGVVLQVEGVGLAHEAVQQLGRGVDLIAGQEDALDHGHVDGVEVLDDVDRHDQQHQDQQHGVRVLNGEDPGQEPIPALARQLIGGDQQIHQGQDQRYAHEVEGRADENQKEQQDEVPPLLLRKDHLQFCEQGFLFHRHPPICDRVILSYKRGKVNSARGKRRKIPLSGLTSGKIVL